MELPPSLKFDDNALTDIVVYSMMFVVAATGNLTVFITLCRNKHQRSRVNFMIMHLAAADLMVTLINIPLEVAWRVTTQWLAGNVACKLFQFVRAFGLYLSSLVLVCISLDRYFAIVHPLKVNDAQRRSKMMVCLAWSVAAVCSVPQSVIFHVDSHPDFVHFKQCVAFGFSTQAKETMYNLFCLAAMYFLPLMVIIVVYLRILWEISQKSKDSEEPKKKKRRGSGGGGYGSGRQHRGEAAGGGGGRGGKMRLRRSDTTNIERARSRTLRMTVIIVLAFVWCWTPYVVIVMWYMLDRTSAEQVDKRLQDVLVIMAVSNSCVNPIVYGTYTINLRRELERCFGRRGRNARGGAAANSSLHHGTTRRSTGNSMVARSTVTTQVRGSTCLKTSFTQVSTRCNNITVSPPKQGQTHPPEPAQSGGSGCLMVEIEAESSFSPAPNPPGGTVGAGGGLPYGEASDFGREAMQLTSFEPLRPGSEGKAGSRVLLLENGVGGGAATLMLTAC